MNEDLLCHFWWRAEERVPRFAADEVKRWPAEFDRLRQSGLLKETELASSVMCYNCGHPHIEHVFYPNQDLFGRTRPHIVCPDEGLIEIDIDDMRQWLVDREALVRMLAAALETTGPIAQIVPNRVWSLGRRRLGERFRDFFLVPGAVRPDGPAVIANADRIASAASPVILVPSTPPRPEQGKKPAMPVFCLSEIAALGEGRLMLDLAYIEDALTRDRPAPLAPRNGRERLEEDRNVFRREQDFWVVSFQGNTVRLRHIVGFDYIAELLRQPGREVEALSLAGRSEPDTEAVVASAGIEMADEKTLRQVRAALETRSGELAAMPAKDWPGRGRLEEEIAKLEGYLSQAEARNGHARKIGGSAQRARTAVTNAVVRAIQSIEKEHRDLAAHLHDSIRTGTTLLYLPPEPVDWRF